MLFPFGCGIGLYLPLPIRLDYLDFALDIQDWILQTTQFYCTVENECIWEIHGPSELNYSVNFFDFSFHYIRFKFVSNCIISFKKKKKIWKKLKKKRFKIFYARPWTVDSSKLLKYFNFASNNFSITKSRMEINPMNNVQIQKFSSGV